MGSIGTKQLSQVCDFEVCSPKKPPDIPQPANRKLIGTVGLVLAFGPDNLLFVESMDPESPADVSGKISEGDKLISVNGKDARSMSYDEVMRSISGPAGTKVTLGFIPAERHQPEHATMHLRELLFHWKVVEVTTLTRIQNRRPQQQSFPIPITPRSVHEKLAPPPPPPANKPANFGVMGCSDSRDNNEGAGKWWEPGWTHGPPHDIDHDPPPQPPPPPPPQPMRHNPPTWAAGEALTEGVSASVGEVELSGRFKPLVLA